MQLMAQTFFISRLEQSRTERAVHFDGCSDDRRRSWIFPFFVFSVTLCLCGDKARHSSLAVHTAHNTRRPRDYQWSLTLGLVIRTCASAPWPSARPRLS